MLLSPGFLLLVAIAGVAIWRMRVAAAPLQELGKDELKELQTLVKNRTSHAEMPMKFRQPLTAQGQITRVYVFTIVATIIVLFLIVFFGWGLGLTPNG